jgi:hypothetical protein
MKNIEIAFNNFETFVINMQPSSVTESLLSMLKHLNKIPLQFYNFDNPYKFKYDVAIKQLLRSADSLKIIVEVGKLKNQKYLNYLHMCYEKGYNGDNEWLQYHEAIHMLEIIHYGNLEPVVRLDYREKAGPLKRPYTFNELLDCQTKFKAGDCFIEFSELGKTPERYWLDGEPEDLQRLCELAKPMLSLSFKLVVALTDLDRSSTHDMKFNEWFSTYHDAWCNHWKIPYWTVDQIRGGLLIGHIDNIDVFANTIKSNNIPIKIALKN